MYGSQTENEQIMSRGGVLGFGLGGDFNPKISGFNAYFAKKWSQTMCLEPRSETGPVFRDFPAHNPSKKVNR